MPRTTPTNPVTQIILDARLVAILRLDDLTRAIPLVDALLRGGIRALEFTLTNPDAPKVVERVLNEFQEFRDGKAIIGIGSVRTPDEALRSIDAGAQFLVSPITHSKTISCSLERNIPIYPGAFSPSEIASAWEQGVEIVKVFPARGLEPNYIQDVLAPMPYLRLMPTGGISAGNLGEYIKAGAVAVGIGGKLADLDSILTERWDTIIDSAKQLTLAVNAVPRPPIQL